MFNNSMQIREVQAQNNRYWWAGHLLKVGVAYDSPGFFFVLFYTGMTSYSSCWMQTKRGLNRVWLIFSECATKTILILTAMSLMGRTLIRHHVGALPLIHRIAERMGLRALFDGAIQSHGNDQVPVVDTLILLIYNLTLGKEPLYELPEWVGSIDRRVIGYQALEPERFTDDRFARALDRLYQADRASLMTELVLTFSRAFDLDLSRIHNDSTTVKAYGEYPGKTASGFELKQGHSKDHRPDLKQLLFSLSVSADGAVPVHHKSYPGNRTDDEGQTSLAIYPEDRDSTRPTTSKIFDRFERLSTYSIADNERVLEEFKDELTDTQQIILNYLGIDERTVWSSN